MTGLFRKFWMEARAMVILKIAFDLGRPVMIKDFCAITGGHHDTVTKYCHILATMGLLTRVSCHAGWTPTAQGLAFMRTRMGLSAEAKLSTGAVDNSSAQVTVRDILRDYPEYRPDLSANIPNNRVNLAENPHLSAGSLRCYPENQVNIPKNWVNSAENPLILAESKGSIPKNPLNYAKNWRFSPENPLNSADSGLLINTTTTTIDSSVVEVLSAESAFFRQNYKIFQEIGITLNPQTLFIATHIAPEVLRAEWRKLEDKGKPWPGLLIRILSSQPKRKSKAHRDREMRLRYAQWAREDD